MQIFDQEVKNSNENESGGRQDSADFNRNGGMDGSIDRDGGLGGEDESKRGERAGSSNQKLADLKPKVAPSGSTFNFE